MSCLVRCPQFRSILSAVCEMFDISGWRLVQYEEGDMYEQFRSFYDDVFPEFAEAGEILQFKVRVCGEESQIIFTTHDSQVSCNYEPHLRGNVYVQYKR